MELRHTREELETEKLLLKRRLETIQRQLEAYDDGSAVYVETHYDYKERIGEE
jgi:hypothetical protein